MVAESKQLLEGVNRRIETSIREIKETVGKRGSVVAGTGSNSTAEAVEAYRRALEMAAALESGEHERLRMVAEILQRVRPDILLLNEFDYDPAVDAAALFNRNYLAVAARGREAIEYPWHFRAPVNTGVDSGLDLDGDGETGGPGDAWGFGRFPGQYGMAVFSRS